MGMHHIISLFDDELKYLEDQVQNMGELAIIMINSSVDAIINNDKALARKIIESDLELDNLERVIDEKATAIIAKRQPMAVDLRQIIGTIKMASDLERIGDKGKNIAKRSLTIMQNDHPSQFYDYLKDFANLTVKQLQNALQAYRDKSQSMIASVLACDDKIDDMYSEFFQELLSYMMKNPDKITACTELLFCAKNLERVGDHATNIVESLHYIIAGKYLPLEGYKFEDEWNKVKGN